MFGKTLMRGLLAAALLVCVVTGSARAVDFSEDFSAGIQPGRWDIFRDDAAGAPWTITAPDPNGGLQLSKGADSDPLTANVQCTAGIQSRFQLIGDFSVTVAFDLVNFGMVQSKQR